MTNKSHKRAKAAAAAATCIDPRISLVGVGAILLSGKQRFTISFAAKADEGSLPGLLRLYPPPEVLEIVRDCDRVHLEILGVAFRSNIAGCDDDKNAVLIAAAPFFRALAKAVTQQFGRDW